MRSSGLMHGLIAALLALGGATLVRADHTSEGAVRADQGIPGPSASPWPVTVVGGGTGGGPVQITSPLPLPVTVSGPSPLPVSVVSPLPVVGLFSLPSPLPVVVATPLPVSVISPLPVTVTSPLPIIGTVSISGPSPLPVTVTSPLPVTVVSPLPVTVVSPLPVTVTSPLPVTVVSPLPVLIPSPLPITGPIKSATFNANGNVTNLHDTFTVDTLGFASGYMEFSTAGTCQGGMSFAFQGDNDPTFPQGVNSQGAGVYTDPGNSVNGPSEVISQINALFDPSPPYAFAFGGPYRVAFTQRYFRVIVFSVGSPCTTVHINMDVFSMPVVPPIQVTQSQILNQFGNSVASFGPDVQSNSLSVSIASDQPAIPVSIASPLPVVVASPLPVVVISPLPITGTVDASGHTVPISAASLPLPTGASTDVAQGSTTSGQTGGLTQGAVTTSAPSYSTGKTDPISLTTTGLLRVDGSGVTQPVSGTFFQATQPVSGTVTANAGTGTFTVGGTVTANAGTNLNTSALALDTSVNGLLTAQASTTSGQSGPLAQTATTTGSPTYSTGKTNPLSTTTAGALRVDGSAVTQPVSGTFFQATQPVSGTVTANAGTGTFTVSGTVTANAGTNLNTSALALDTSVNGLLLGQASTTSGQKGPIVQGAVTTNAPSYSTAQTDPLSLDPSGLLRVSLKDTPANTNKFLVTPDSVALPANQSVNVSQFGGTNASTGTGAGGAGIPRVTVSNDSAIKVWDGTNVQAVKAASTAAAATDPAAVVVQSPNGLNPCFNPSAKLLSSTAATSGTAAVLIVAASGSTKVYVCSLTVIGVSGTTPTFSLVQGTGATCAGSQTVLVQSWTTAAGSIYSFAAPVAVTAASNAVCYLDTGTTPVQRYTLTYVQQ